MGRKRSTTYRTLATQKLLEINAVWDDQEYVYDWFKFYYCL